MPTLKISQINKQTLHLKKPEKEQTKGSRKNAVIKMSIQINKTESRKIEKKNKWFLEKINKFLARLTRKQNLKLLKPETNRIPWGSSG